MAAPPSTEGVPARSANRSRRSSSSITPGASPSSASPESVRAASRARAGHSPPAASAMASRGRQLSAARSCSPSGTSGSAASSSAIWSPAHRHARRRTGSSQCRRSTRRRSTVSSARRRRIRSVTARSWSVAGSSPIRAMALGAHVLKARGSKSSPAVRTTTAVARVWPLLMMPRSSWRSRRNVSASSTSSVDPHASTARNIAAGVMLAAGSGRRTSAPSTARAVVLPLRPCRTWPPPVAGRATTWSRPSTSRRTRPLCCRSSWAAGSCGRPSDTPPNLPRKPTPRSRVRHGAEVGKWRRYAPKQCYRGCSSVGRAPALQAGGHRFEPGQLHVVGSAAFRDRLPDLGAPFPSAAGVSGAGPRRCGRRRRFRWP